MEKKKSITIFLIQFCRVINELHYYSQIIQFHNFVSIHSKCLYSVTITFSKPLWQLIQWQDVMKIIKISRFWGQNMDKFLMHIKILALLNCMRTCFNHLITRKEVGKKEMYHLHLEWKFPMKNSSISENRFIIFQNKND